MSPNQIIHLQMGTAFISFPVANHGSVLAGLLTHPNTVEIYDSPPHAVLHDLGLLSRCVAAVFG